MRRWLPFALLIALAAGGAMLVLHREPRGAPLPAAELRTEPIGQDELSAADRPAAGLSTRAVEPSSAGAPTGAGERPAARLVVRARPDENDERVFGLVLDAQAQVPIAGARVELRGGFGQELPAQTCTSGRDGRFEFLYTSWTKPYLHIEHEGFGPRLANPAGHDDPTHPLLVHLARAGALRLFVRDPSNAPVAGVRVELTARRGALELEPGQGSGFFMREYVSAPESTWKAETGADGRATIDGLPAGVELRSVLAWGAVRTHLDPDPLELEPGETRALEVHLEGNTRIRGLALDQEGRPIGKLEIRLSPCSSEPLQRSLLVEHSEVRARTHTNELGRFELETPGPGCWILTPGGGGGPDSIAAQPLRVATAGEGEIGVKLSCFRGLFLAGIVLDPGGNPVANARVEAYAEGEWFWGDARSGADGRFRLGPTTSDECTLLAYGRDGLAGSAPIRARAADEGIVLRLQLAGSMRGRVVDGATGASCGGQLLYTPETRGYGPFGHGGMLSLEDDGGFVIGTLLPGRYGVCAMSADGRFAEQGGIEVVAGRESAGFVLALAPGGKLALHYAGSRPLVFVRVTRNGVPVHFGEVLAAGARALVQAPAGELVLEVRDDPVGEPRRLPVTLAAGETRELDIGD